MVRAQNEVSAVVEPDSIFAFEHTAKLADETARRLDRPVRPIVVHTFPDGESLVRAERDQLDRALIFCSLDRPNEKIFDLLLAADALRQQGVRQLGLVAPYLAYMRQDRVFRPGEPISQRVLAGLLDGAFDEIMTIEAHLHRIAHLSEIFTCRAHSFSAAPAIATWLKGQRNADLIVGPDAESEPWIRDVASRASLPWLVGSKTRHSDRHVEIQFPDTPKNVRSAWIIDDIASSGKTLEKAATALRDRGLERIGAVIVHALFGEQTLARLASAGIDSVVSTNSIPHPTNAISLAPLIAEKISSVGPTMEDHSVHATPHGH